MIDMIRVDFSIDHVLSITDLIDLEREIKAWCYKNFGEDSWIMGPGAGYVYFDHESDAAWFRLRWA